MAKLPNEVSGRVSKGVVPATNSSGLADMDVRDSADRSGAGPLHCETHISGAGPQKIDSGHHCDACPFCWDVCSYEGCTKCSAKRGKLTAPVLVSNTKCSSQLGRSIFCEKPENRKYTPCQLRRHNHADSAWLLVGERIYDATSYVSQHPGGKSSILRKSGGKADCEKDMTFHSKNAIKIWKRNEVGKLTKCPGFLGDFGDNSVNRESDICGASEQCVIS
uniref:Cytochrome b5 heme-binding domain-containing protein n=1 Tax=Odontella aurita TaxID=265563 RepID=A0A7S4J744_9STRA|mmetsp:Transcript_40417/g.121789  ORF Transcript_40417/g.121789 Transcript_40417/m.121789 type:complete len:220 (+) Transcript_40417:283-942(+)